MSAPVFLVDDLGPADDLGRTDDLAPNEGVGADRLLLTGSEGRHAAGVRRVQPGEAVDLVDGRGGRAHCRVLTVSSGEVVLDVLARTVEPAPSPWLVLVQALPKGDRGELAVELATEVGVDEIVPWAASRCVAQWKAERGLRQLERWRSTAREAAKQSRRARVPTVAALHSTPELVRRLAGATVLALHEAATTRLTGVALPVAGEVAVVVGPEGGLTEQELAALGGTTVRLGPEVLRTSTAGAAAVAVLSARTGRW